VKAVVVHEHGGPAVLQYGETADPKPDSDEVLIEVRAASINHIDIWVRKGLPDGADTWVKSLRAARKGGRVLTCEATTGYSPQTDLRQIFYRQVQVIGSTMGSPAEFAEVMRCVFRGQLKPVVDRVLPLSEAPRAHEAIERREIFGKVVLRPWSND
jgi:NADPH:quinone reductase-like Zn-dependent oxidoreductase